MLGKEDDFVGNMNGILIIVYETQFNVDELWFVVNENNSNVFLGLEAR